MTNLGAKYVQTESVISRVLGEYVGSWESLSIQPRGSAGGFSGAQFWRIKGADSDLCLRRWPPEHPDSDRLALIHSTLQDAGGAGLSFLPIPHPTRNGASFVEMAGTLWELTNWLPGQADFQQQPTDARLTNVMQAVAKFHLATTNSADTARRSAPPPGLVERHQILLKLLAGELASVTAAARRVKWTELDARIDRFLPLFWKASPAVTSLLTGAVSEHVTLQPCIRDLRSDHLLFTGDCLTGLVDFGALRIDYWAGDVARLLGGLVPDETDRWQAALDVYHAVRPFSPNDKRLIEVYDRSNVLMSPASWLRWIGVEKRRFDEPERILTILDDWLARLELAADG